MLEIVTYGNPILTEKAKEVTEFGPNLEKTIEEMHLAMRQDRGIGLAAPQVAIGLRLFIVELDDEPLRVFINPRITALSQETSEYEEGCLSFPGLYFNVVRPSAVEIEAQDAHGQSFRLKAEGLLARVIQHEYDHLEGVLFIDRISPLKRRRALAHYQKLLNM